MTPLFAATWWFGRIAVNEAWRHWVGHRERLEGNAQERPSISAGQLLAECVERAVVAVEMDRRIHSVGRGGLPNAAGKVELDAAWMDGDRLQAGGVAAMTDILPAISVARLVMEKTPHLLQVGKGAERFARKHGFRRRQLLTKVAVRRWEQWRRRQAREGSRPTYGHDTVGVIGWQDGHLVVACSTSGLPWKLPGRVGDSPVVGAGLYADDQAGAAVATGLGEEILRFCVTSRVVEAMRRGANARRACRDVIRFMVRRRPETAKTMVAVLAVRQDGDCGTAATQDGFPAYVRTGRRIIKLHG
ncbi:MAG TPA: isoaspartyl peptidase/L-asparaginase [Verrucomicrobiae bacterium]|nr:isoaspartyl peptidase/L-asparaginase [Verrucomicrobiae bacterium]